MVGRSLEQSTIASFRGTQWVDLTHISYIYIYIWYMYMYIYIYLYIYIYMVCIYIYGVYIYIHTWYLGVWIPACSAGCLEHFRHRARDGFVSVHVVSVSGGRQGRQKNKKPTWYWWGSDYSLWSCASKLDFFGEWYDIINHIQHLSDSPWMFSNNCNLVVMLLTCSPFPVFLFWEDLRHRVIAVSSASSPHQKKKVMVYIHPNSEPMATTLWPCSQSQV